MSGSRDVLEGTVYAWRDGTRVALRLSVLGADGGVRHWCPACETGYSLEAIARTLEDRQAMAALLRSLADKLDPGAP